MPFFRRLLKPATPPGTPAINTQSLPDQASDQRLPAHLEPGLSEPENILALGSAGTLGLYAIMLALGPSIPHWPLAMSASALIWKILQVSGWAATIGIGSTSRFRSYRFMGYVTALAVSGIYLVQRFSGLPAYQFFGLSGTLGLVMLAGNLTAWWLARKRSDGA